jgi:hypothetical protein
MKMGMNLLSVVCRPQVHKKLLASFPSPAGMSLPNSPWVGIMTSYINYSWPGRVWLVTSRLGMGGNSITSFYGVPSAGAFLLEVLDSREVLPSLVGYPGAATCSLYMLAWPIKHIKLVCQCTYHVIR